MKMSLRRSCWPFRVAFAAVGAALLPAACISLVLAPVWTPKAVAQDDKVEKFFVAVAADDVATIDKLLTQGVSVDVRSKYGNTGLMMAAGYKSSLPMLRFLLSKGANPDLKAKDKDGRTALDIARQSDNADGIALLEPVTGRTPAAPAPAKAPQASAPQAEKPIAPAPPTEKLLPLPPRPGYVIGRAVFADGRAIPNFKVSAVGFDGLAHVTTFSTAIPSLGEVKGSNGRYALRTTYEVDRSRAVSATVVGVSAETEVNFNGKTFTIMLHPVDGKANGTDEDHFRGNSGKGVVRDFVMKISGRKPGYEDRDDSSNAFYGAPVKLDLTTGDGRTYGSDLASTTPKGSVITVTFAPNGALLDGSAGQIVTRTVRVTSRADYYFYLQDIPIGNYTATAQMIGPDGTARKLKLSTEIIRKSEEFQASARIEIMPKFSALLGGADGGTLSLAK